MSFLFFNTPPIVNCISLMCRQSWTHWSPEEIPWYNYMHFRLKLNVKRRTGNHWRRVEVKFQLPVIRTTNECFLCSMVVKKGYYLTSWLTAVITVHTGELWMTVGSEESLFYSPTTQQLRSDLVTVFRKRKQCSYISF